jgi:hypothetical protein
MSDYQDMIGQWEQAEWYAKKREEEKENDTRTIEKVVR